MEVKGGRPRKGTIIEKDYEWENARVKIAHFVRRNGIEKKCVICGKDGEILHNRENPYKIAFICSECRNDPEKEKLAEKRRFDVRNKVPKKGTHILKTSTDEYITKVVNNYLNDVLPIREYCKKIGISNRQFHTILNRYKELYPNQPIDDYVKSHRNTVHRKRIEAYKQVDV